MQKLLKPLIFLLSLLPAAYMLYAVWLSLSGQANLLGPDPAKALALSTGEWAIRFLVLTLAMTPLRYLFNWPYAWRLRKMLGLFCLFYASLHFLIFLALLLQFRWAELGQEILERPYVTLGFAAYVLLLPLGLTSFQAAQRRLGRRWKRLHQMIYLIAILAVLHVVWIVRSSYFDAVLYGGLVTLLLGYRLLRHHFVAVRRFSFRPPARSNAAPTRAG